MDPSHWSGPNATQKTLFPSRKSTKDTGAKCKLQQSSKVGSTYAVRLRQLGSLGPNELAREQVQTKSTVCFARLWQPERFQRRWFHEPTFQWRGGFSQTFPVGKVSTSQACLGLPVGS